MDGKCARHCHSMSLLTRGSKNVSFISLCSQLCLFKLSLYFVLQRFLYPANCTTLRLGVGRSTPWRTGAGSCYLGKAGLQKSDAVLRQIKFREADITRGLENDLFETAMPKSPRKPLCILRGVPAAV